MKTLVDTCVWSQALRRGRKNGDEIVSLLNSLIIDQKVQMIGPIRQELLSGIRSKKQFAALRSYLTAFPDLPIRTSDHELAAEFFNLNRKHGIQGSHTDFLICALSHNYKMPIFTLDADFENYARYIPIFLYALC